MDTLLNLEYDQRADYLFASFGAPGAGIGVDLPNTPVTLMVDHNRQLRGFDIVAFRAHSPHKIPLLSKVPDRLASIPRSTHWLELALLGDDLRIAIQDRTEEKVVVRDFAARAATGLDVYLSSLLEPHTSY